MCVCVCVFQQNMLWVFIRMAPLGYSNEYPQHMFGNKNDKNITKIIFLSVVVNYSFVEMTGNYSPKIQQNIIELTLGTRGKKSADDIL